MTDQQSEEADDNNLGRRRLPSRSTRGKRIAELEGIDKEVDDEFWKMTMFAEEEQDNEFETTNQMVEEEQDVEDSDMDDYTSDEEGEQKRAQNLEKKIAREEKQTKKRKNVYKDTTAADSKKSKKTKSSAEDKSEKPPKAPKTPKTTSSSSTSPTITKRSSRKSTIKATEASEEKLKTTKKTKQAKAPKEVKQLTQEELLEEAKITQELNKASLRVLVQIEEDVRKKARDSKSRNTIDPNEPRVKFISRNGTHLIEFINQGIPDFINNKKMSEEEINRFDIPKEEKQVKCVITGLPAKYIDPLTRKPYATVEAFKEIRQKFKKE